MKTSVLLITLLLPFATFSQSWTFEKGGSAFDGTYKTSSVVGVGYEFPYTKPLFVVNVFRGDVSNPNIYITRVPYAGCENNRILIKFDNDDKVYEPVVSSSRDHEQWFMEFEKELITVKDSIKKLVKYYIVKENQIVKLRKAPDPISEIIYEVSANDTIKLLYQDGLYWICKYRKTVLYANEMYITNVDKAIPTHEEIFVPYERQDFNKDQPIEFIKDLKSHSIMHVRLLSDCVKSDFEFSLKGSTAALNFVLSK